MLRCLLLQETTVRRRRGFGEEISVTRLTVAGIMRFWRLLLSSAAGRENESVFGHCKCILRAPLLVHALDFYSCFLCVTVMSVLLGVET
jgi:hypothetical protein